MIFSVNKTICPNRKRLLAHQILEHRWLDDALETLISTVRLKRYVIRKRWVKAVNTILALKRMGARIDVALI